MFDFLKKKEHTNSEDRSFDPLAATYNDSSLGTLAVGQNNNNVIVNVVSRRKIKKGYEIGGVLDQEQRNNWKACRAKTIWRKKALTKASS